MDGKTEEEEWQVFHAPEGPTRYWIYKDGEEVEVDKNYSSTSRNKRIYNNREFGATRVGSITQM